MADRDGSDQAPAAVTCTGCGTVASGGTPLGWSTEISERGPQVLCDACTRSNVRSIEAKLGTDWW